MEETHAPERDLGDDCSCGTTATLAELRCPTCSSPRIRAVETCSRTVQVAIREGVVVLLMGTAEVDDGESDWAFDCLNCGMRRVGVPEGLVVEYD